MISEGSCDWSNDAENLALIKGINYILKYIQIESSYFKYCFCFILDQINAAWWAEENSLKKH